MLNILEGIRVIDLSSVVLGPYATQMLGDLGADVIKVEPPNGDIYRHIAPQRHSGMGAGFLNLNRNKRSLCLDLKNDEDWAVFERLIEGADVLIHNMRSVAARRLGIDFESMQGINPRLVYCNAVGFGADGPYADRPAYDDVVQSESGLTRLGLTGDEEPAFVPTVIADKVGALFATQGVLSALFHRQRTGEGVAVEAPMFESLVNFLLVEHMNGRVFDTKRGHAGYDRLLNPFHRPYRTRDGYMAAMPYSTGHWVKVLKLLGRQDLAEADWVVDDGRRSEHIADLYAVLAENLPERSTQDWMQAFTREDIPCAVVNELADLFEDEHLQAVGFFQRNDHPTEGAISHTRYPLRFGNVGQRPDAPVPTLGEHWREIMIELGFDPDEDI